MGTSSIHYNLTNARGYFNPAGRIWVGGYSMIPSELPELGPEPKQQLGNVEQETWKDKNYTRKLNPIQIN